MRFNTGVDEQPFWKRGGMTDKNPVDTDNCDAPAFDSEAFSESVEQKRDAILAENLVSGLAVAAVNGFLLVGLLAFNISSIWLAPWFGVLLFSTIVRTAIAIPVRKQKRRFSRREKVVIALLSAIAGALWGIPPFFVDASANASLNSLIVFMIAGMTAAACLSYATHFILVAAFNAPALLVLSVYFISKGGLIEYALCALLALYLAATLAIARRNGRTVAHTLASEAYSEQRRLAIEEKRRELNKEIAARNESERRLTETLNRTRDFNAALERIYRAYLTEDRSTESRE